MPELLDDEEFAHFKDHLRGQRDAATDGGAQEPDEALLKILSQQSLILMAPTITIAAEILGKDAVVLSEAARHLGMNKPYVAVNRSTY